MACTYGSCHPVDLTSSARRRGHRCSEFAVLPRRSHALLLQELQLPPTGLGAASDFVLGQVRRHIWAQPRAARCHDDEGDIRLDCESA